MNAVTGVAWVKRGVAKSQPTRAELSEKDLKKLMPGNEESENDDNSDDDDGSGPSGLAFYKTNADDPQLAGDDSDEDDADIMPEDNVIAVSRVKDEMFCLEAWVYNQSEKYIYCHHDYILPSCPIVLEWVGYGQNESSPGNLVAVGTMDPSIELWNLDVMNTLDPALVLAGTKRSKKKVPEKKKRKVAVEGHTDAVLDLSWNSLEPHVLASASADACVGIWDLTAGSCVMINSLHSDKVQAVQWHPVESQILLSGSFDKHVKLVDCRSTDTSQRSWNLDGEVEKVLWNSHNVSQFFASTETGSIFCYDIREDKPLFEMKAHKSAVTSLTLSPTIEGCLITSSEDQSIKVWDVRSNSPKLVEQRNCKIGALFSAAACPDAELLLCVGGERELRVTDLKDNENVVACFKENRSVELPASTDEEEDTEENNSVAKTTKQSSKNTGSVQKKKKKTSKSKQNQN